MPPEINWDDPAAVAAARGDDLIETPADDKTVLDAEGKAAADAAAEADKKKEEEDAALAKKSEDEAAAKAAAEDKGKAGDGDGKSGDGKAGDGDDDGDDDDHRIPKSRLDAKNRIIDEEKAKSAALQKKLDYIEASRENADTKARQVAAAKQQHERKTAEGTIEELDTQIAEAYKDGDTDKAASLRAEQRKMERSLYLKEAQDMDLHTSQATRESMRLDVALEQIEEMYPQLDPNDNTNYDDALVAEIQELRGGFLATGKYTPTQALVKAVRTYIPAEESKDELDADKDDKDLDKETKAQKEAKEKQTAAALKKATDAANAQAPNTQGVGDDSDTGGLQATVDPDKLSLDDLENMPLDQLKKLRGDFRTTA